jgi:hypothetical protein
LRGFVAFQQTHGFLKIGRSKPLSCSELEVKRFLEYLRKDRGAADSTCGSCQRRVQHFLKFLGFDHNTTAIKSLTLAKVHRYIAGAHCHELAMAFSWFEMCARVREDGLFEPHLGRHVRCNSKR